MVCAGQDGCAATTLMNATRTATLSRISRQSQSVGLVEIDNTRTFMPIIQTDFNSIGSKCPSGACHGQVLSAKIEHPCTFIPRQVKNSLINRCTTTIFQCQRTSAM